MQNSKSVTFQNHNRFGQCLYIDNAISTARVTLFGAHLLSFVLKNDQRERLYLSDNAIFDGISPIRGGVPICWPWFGPSKRNNEHPNHGFARTQNWTLDHLNEISDPKGNIIETQLRLLPERLGLFNTPNGLKIEILLTIGKHCEVKLLTQNDSDQEVSLSQAIHSYFRVNDISKVKLSGVDQDYYNKLDNSFNNPSPVPYMILAETDRVHMLGEQKSEHHISIHEDESTLQDIYQSGHNATVVWNPWEQNSVKMKDMDNDGYKNMLCIEAATEPQIVLAPGQHKVLIQRFY